MTTRSLPPCPVWCTLPPDHELVPDRELVPRMPFDPDGRVHRAPRFGKVAINMDDLEGFGYAVQGHDLMPVNASPAGIVADLHELAVDLLAAAKWLESVQ